MKTWYIVMIGGGTLQVEADRYTRGLDGVIYFWRGEDGKEAEEIGVVCSETIVGVFEKVCACNYQKQ